MKIKTQRMNKRIRYCLAALGVVAGLLMSGGQALAHKFFVSAWVEEGSVFLEAGFGDGSMAHGAEIIVFDDAGTQLFTAKTNDQGEYNFKIPKKSALRLKVKAGMGHQDEVIVPFEEIEAGFEGADEPVQGTTPSSGAAPQPQATVSSSSAGSPSAVSGVSAQEIQRIIDKSLDKKLKPIIRKLASKDDGGPRFQDIAGGIGYIIGLVGLGTYISYRRREGK